MQTCSNSTLIVMRGFPGTGKSTIARMLAMSLHVPLIDRDVIRQTGVDTLGEIEEIGWLAYELMFALAREQLKLGLSVVIDSPLTYYSTYLQARQMADVLHVPMLVVHCQCAEELQRRRLEQRKGEVAAFQLTSWEEWLRWKPRFEHFEDHGCVLDTARPLNESLARIIEALRALHATV